MRIMLCVMLVAAAGIAALVGCAEPVRAEIPAAHVSVFWWERTAVPADAELLWRGDCLALVVTPRGRERPGAYGQLHCARI